MASNEGSDNTKHVRHAIVASLTDTPKRLLDGQVALLADSDVNNYNTQMAECLRQLQGIMTMVGYDWMGRPIGVLHKESGMLGLYDAIFDEFLEFDAPEDDISASRLFDPAADNFGQDEYRSFLRKIGIGSLELGDCAGFTVPPQLGGEVSHQNMEIYSLFVYWNFISLLDEAIGDLPVGTILKSISIGKGLRSL